METGYVLYPVDEFVHQHLTARVAVLAASVGSEGHDAHLNKGSVGIPDQSRASRVAVAGSSSVGSRRAHHVFGDERTVKIAANAIGQNLDLHFMKSSWIISG